jgi:hypothetical protein
LSGAFVGPLTVRAGGDPLASPTLPAPEWIAAPEMTGINPAVSESEGNQGESHPSDFYCTAPGISPLLPVCLEVDPTSLGESPQVEWDLAVPLRTQEASTAHCGPAALGMALDFMNLKMGGRNPSTRELVSFLEDRGLMQEWGTGLEELVYAARAFGYPGSRSFSGWTLEQLADELQGGNPVVVLLGEGQDQPGHFATVKGISFDEGRILYNDPMSGIIDIKLDEFLEYWFLKRNSGLTVKWTKHQYSSFKSNTAH